LDEEHKQEYKDKYTKAKQKGVKFFPDIIYKDTVVAFGVFVILIMLAVFAGVPNEPKADPSDSAYIPRPEWYFLFLFEMLKYFPGKIEWIGTFIIPTIAVLALLLLPFLDRNPKRHFSKRRLGISIMSVIVIGMVALTISAVITTPKPEEVEEVAVTLPEKILAGEELYNEFCVECHSEGEGGEIKGVEGLEGVILKPINTQDEMYTRSDDTLFEIINQGQPALGMTPFGKAFGGELSVAQMENIVTYMGRSHGAAHRSSPGGRDPDPGAQ
jgi:mono/diheme cytochrome c family protein